mmetsp:Transcript_4909/g.16837  ORF Transcript_4909/g.16837 Transcript_4909/m.16837 type:complete len:214 (-) Transcript_4909:4277-4918(-)
MTYETISPHCSCLNASAFEHTKSKSSPRVSKSNATSSTVAVVAMHFSIARLILFLLELILSLLLLLLLSLLFLLLLPGSTAPFTETKFVTDIPSPSSLDIPDARSSLPGDQCMPRPKPPASDNTLTCGATSSSIQAFIFSPIKRGCAANLGTKLLPSSRQTALSVFKAGHSHSGETKSGVTPGDIPPQSLMPAFSNALHPSSTSSPGVKFGGT